MLKSRVAMIRKIMVMVAVAATVVLTSQGVQAQERRQVMLDRVVAGYCRICNR